MPMETTLVSGLPVTPSHLPERTRSVCGNAGGTRAGRRAAVVSRHAKDHTSRQAETRTNPHSVPTREGLDLVQHLPHLGHHVAAALLVANHRAARGAQRDVQHRPALGRVQVLALKHGGHLAGHVGCRGQVQQQLQGGKAGGIRRMERRCVFNRGIALGMPGQIRCMQQRCGNRRSAHVGRTEHAP